MTTWTEERPSEPGEYWLSMPPEKRSRHGEWKAAVLAVRLINECSLLQASHALSTGAPVPVNLVIRWLSGSVHRRGPCVKSSELDGALWAPRETPADPFKEVGT